jgi:regulator of protease activity HflC (stomatin/prohibitin superfamily)
LGTASGDGTVIVVVRFATAVQATRGISMKITTTLAVAAGLAALTACNNNPQENKADNIEANAENSADLIEANAANAADNLQANAENTADAVRNAGDNTADAVRNSADNATTNNH